MPLIGEEPHEEKVPAEAEGNLIRCVQQLPEPVQGNKRTSVKLPDADAVDLVGVLVGRDGSLPSR